jgi:hypothetical protein
MISQANLCCYDFRTLMKISSSLQAELLFEGNKLQPPGRARIIIAEFRVYCHAPRRAGESRLFFESVPSCAAFCGVKITTARAALQRLAAEVATRFARFVVCDCYAVFPWAILFRHYVALNRMRFSEHIQHRTPNIREGKGELTAAATSSFFFVVEVVDDALRDVQYVPRGGIQQAAAAGRGIRDDVVFSLRIFGHDVLDGIFLV